MGQRHAVEPVSLTIILALLATTSGTTNTGSPLKASANVAWDCASSS